MGAAFGKSQGSQRPTAMGSLLQASCYGATIPVIYGQTQSPLLAIWAANLRQGGSVKKFKQMKKGITAYVENIDFLLGHNPLRGVLQMYDNGTPFPLTYTSQTFASFTAPGDLVVTDPYFYFVTAVTQVVEYSFSVDDYGGSAQTLTGSYEIPFWNELESGPDPTGTSAYRNFPYCYRWAPGYGATIALDAFGLVASAGPIKVYYAQLMPATSYQPPITKLRMAFENQLGSGTEYADAPAPFNTQQIIYPHFAGLGSSDIDLGSSGALPQLQAEVAGKWGIYPTGDADFADIIEDVYKSGLAQAAIGATTAYTQMERGLSSYDLPGAIQRKVNASATAAMPPMLYDMANTAGNYLVVTATGAGTLTIASSNGETWTPVLPDGMGYQAWVAAAVGGFNTVTVSGASAPWSMSALEIIANNATVSFDTYYTGTPGSAGASISKSASGALYGHAATVLWQDFYLPAALPSDAVIQGIYPVMVASGNYDECLQYTQFGSGTVSFNFEGGVNENTGTYTGPAPYFTNPFTPYNSSFASTELWGASIGTSLSVLEDAFMAAGIACSLNAPTLSDSLAVTALGFAIYYTTATPPGSHPITPPFSVPTGQGCSFAFPGSVSSYAPDPVGVVISVDPVVIGVGDGSGSIAIHSTSGTAAYDASGSIFSNKATANTSVQKGVPAFLLAVPFYHAANAPAGIKAAQWKSLSDPNLYGNTPASYQLQGRIVRTPGSYDITVPGPTPSAIVALAFTPGQATSYPRPLGDFLDLPSLDLVRRQCRANGLWGSLSMNTQSSASDWLKTLYAAANAAPVFLGSKLYSYPYSEVSTAGNGCTYTAPTAAGPVANLDADWGDFVGNGTPKLSTASRVQLPNVLQMQCLAREANYNQVVVQQPDAASIALYGVRKADPIVNNAVQDTSVARQLLGVQVRRNQYGGDTWSFTASAKWSLLSPMDLITLTDRLQGLVKVPVRITSYSEQQDGSFEAQAEPFVYGMCAPSPLATTTPASNPVDTGVSAGNVNPPVIFEPVPRLYGTLTQAQLWVVVSSGSPVYGGAQVFISTDGGSSYNPAGDPLIGSATTGVITVDWPAAADPDTTNNLSVDVSECNGILPSTMVSDEDNFLYPCYVQGQDLALDVNSVGAAVGGPLTVTVNSTAAAALGTIKVNGTAVAESNSAAFDYELMTYAVATLTAPSRYTLEATGGNHLRRAVFGAPDAGTGVDHVVGSRFAYLPPSAAGILKLAMDSVWVGHTLYFKILSFNSFGTAQQSLSDVPAYSYTPTGIPSTV